MKLTFEEDLGREDLDGLLLVTQVLHCGIVEDLGVRLSLQDCLLATHELLLGVRLQIRRIHLACSLSQGMIHFN